MSKSSSKEDKAAVKAARKAEKAAKKAKEEVIADSAPAEDAKPSKKKRKAAEEAAAAPAAPKAAKKQKQQVTSSDSAGDPPAAPAPVPENSLDNFRLGEPLKSLLRSKGIETLFAIQAQTLAPLLDGKDVVGRWELAADAGAAAGHACCRMRADALEVHASCS